MTIEFQKIGTIRSCFHQKFGIPRQSNLIPEAESLLVFEKGFADPDFVRGLEGCTHLWILFVFHASAPPKSRLVRPPRLGGREKAGVFATRSNFRPNPIGLSAVRLEEMVYDESGGHLVLRGGDFLDGTPVVDIKPYLPFADSLPEAQFPMAPAPPVLKVAVTFEPAAEQVLQEVEIRYPELRVVIEKVLGYDPRPAQRTEEEDGVYGVHLFDFNIRWRLKHGGFEVFEIKEIGC